MTPYRILHDYGGYEGMKFYDGEYATIGAAIKAAVEASYGCRFLIVQVVAWEGLSLAPVKIDESAIIELVDCPRCGGTGHVEKPSEQVTQQQRGN